uniref:ARAD1C30536p n=1 Tax=Blastobotrys adeninivorans TaxID=409370 RepID=A0A060T385_BLAAD
MDASNSETPPAGDAAYLMDFVPASIRDAVETSLSPGDRDRIAYKQRDIQSQIVKYTEQKVVEFYEFCVQLVVEQRERDESVADLDSRLAQLSSEDNDDDEAGATSASDTSQPASVSSSGTSTPRIPRQLSSSRQSPKGSVSTTRSASPAKSPLPLKSSLAKPRSLSGSDSDRKSPKRVMFSDHDEISYMESDTDSDSSTEPDYDDDDDNDIDADDGDELGGIKFRHMGPTFVYSPNSVDNSIRDTNIKGYQSLQQQQQQQPQERILTPGRSADATVADEPGDIDSSSTATVETSTEKASQEDTDDELFEFDESLPESEDNDNTAVTDLKSFVPSENSAGPSSLVDDLDANLVNPSIASSLPQSASSGQVTVTGSFKQRPMTKYLGNDDDDDADHYELHQSRLDDDHDDLKMARFNDGGIMSETLMSPSASSLPIRIANSQASKPAPSSGLVHTVDNANEDVELASVLNSHQEIDDPVFLSLSARNAQDPSRMSFSERMTWEQISGSLQK